MTTDEIKSELRRIFAERLDMDMSEVHASDADPLFGDEWGLDSVDVIDIVLGLEQTFKVKFKQDEDVEKHFASLNALAAHVQDLTG